MMDDITNVRNVVVSGKSAFTAKAIKAEVQRDRHINNFIR